MTTSDWSMDALGKPRFIQHDCVRQCFAASTASESERE